MNNKNEIKGKINNYNCITFKEFSIYPKNENTVIKTNSML